MRNTVGCLALAGICLALPIIHAVLLAVNFALQSAMLLGQWLSARLPTVEPPKRPAADEDLLLSIHVPACNEPPEVLAQTLRSLARLEWKHYEVLVIDNNTPDPAVWRPIERLCEELGPRFRFFHVDRLSGFKAGALNYLRRRMNRRADFVLVVDADYQLAPDAIRRALRYFTDRQIGLLQFPQHYRNVSPANRGVELDFQHFFSCYMRMANRLACVPSTGTLTFINAHALRAIGGFDEEAITEDAELGFRLTLSGYRNVYIHEVIGHGLLPFDLASLKKQRWRWAFGNAQIIKRNLRALLGSPRLTPGQRLGFLAHLTAWFNFNILPSLSLVALTPLVFLGWLSPLQVYLLVLSGLTLVSFVLIKWGVFFLSLRRENRSLAEITQAFVSHLGLGLIFGTAWMRCLVNDREPFRRTNKFVSRRRPGVIRAVVVETVFGTLLFVAGAALLAADFVIAPAAALLMSVGRFAILWVAHQMRATLQLTQVGQALPEIENAGSVAVAACLGQDGVLDGRGCSTAEGVSAWNLSP